MSTISYRYEFNFSSGRVESFTVELDEKSLRPLDKLDPYHLPEWTRLNFCRCEGCTVDELEEPFCPAAARLEPLARKMGDVVSIDDVEVKVYTDERIVISQTSAQEGLGALMGLITASSGCPFTAFFRPMARFHQPFSSTEETFYRAASMYMLGQYYRWHNDKSVDLDLKGLHQFYDKVARVNKGLADRLRSEKREDGTVNAVVLLDMFVKSLPIMLDETLQELTPLFQSYIDAPHIV